MNLVTLPLATPAQLPPYVASRTFMAFVEFFSSAVLLVTGVLWIMNATQLSARSRSIRPSEHLWSPLASAYDRSHSAARFVHWTSVGREPMSGSHVSASDSEASSGNGLHRLA